MRTCIGMAVVGFGLLAAGPLAGQGKPIELGVDAGFTTQINDPKVSTIGIPLQQLRVGFFASDRVEIEPAVSLNWIKYSGEDALTTVGADLGVLIHLGSDETGTRLYVRPLAGLQHVSAGGSSTTVFSAGGGIGVKVPIRSTSRLNLRFEGGYVHGFKKTSDEIPASDRLQLLVGFSFLTK